MPGTARKRPKGSMYVRNIPADLVAMFKAFCARRNISMRRRIEEHMRDDVRADEPEAARRLRERARRDGVGQHP